MHKTLVLCLFATLPAAAGMFSDLGWCGEWYNTAFEQLGQAGVVRGDSDGRAWPRRVATRGELATLVERYLDWVGRTVPADRRQPDLAAARHDAQLVEGIWGRRFRDVPADHWAADAVERLAGAGVLEGSPGPSRAAEPLTRGDLALTLARLHSVLVLGSLAQTQGTPSVDQAADTLLQVGVLEGEPDGAKALDAPLLREQLAVALSRHYDWVQKTLPRQ